MLEFFRLRRRILRFPAKTLEHVAHTKRSRHLQPEATGITVGDLITLRGSREGEKHRQSLDRFSPFEPTPQELLPGRNRQYAFIHLLIVREKTVYDSRQVIEVVGIGE